MTKLSVIIPSLLKRVVGNNDSGRLFVEDAVASIRAQTVAIDNTIDVKIIVGVDKGTKFPADLAARLGICVAESDGRSVTAALNAAAKLIDGEFLAFLEDDDQWHPLFLQVALEVLKGADFVSSNQMEVKASGEKTGINDFPTASGWIMPHRTWRTVGPFNKDYRFHHDNEWLGRLAEKKIGRIHLVDASVPQDPTVAANTMPSLAALLISGGPCARILRHGLPEPLVRRLVYSDSTLSQIHVNSEFKSRSKYERDLLVKTFGRIPW